MAPMSATPSEEPSCCPVNCRPPASPRPDASTDDWTTSPSCDAMRPMPAPRTAIPIAKAASARSGWIVARSARQATTARPRPARVMARTRVSHRQTRPGRGGEEHADRCGQHLDARLQGVEAEDELQVQRDREEDAHEDEVLREQAGEARPQRRDPQQVEVDERVGTDGLAVSLPGDEGPQQDAAGSDDEWGQGEPERLDGRVLGLDEPPGGRLQDAQDDGPRPAADRNVPTTSSRGLGPVRSASPT